jgi:type II secretory pathway component GspD/PulD (secretin)
MNLKHLFSLSLSLALALTAGAQTNSGGTGIPAVPMPPRQSGTPIVPRTRNAPQPLTNNPAAALPAIPPLPAVPQPAVVSLPTNNPVAAAAQAPNPPASATNAPATATNAPARPPLVAVPPEPADISYSFTMPVEQVVEIYAKLVARTPFRAVAGPQSVAATSLVTLKTESPLTHTEAIQALETVLGMNGITIVPIGEKFFKVVSEATAPMAGGVIISNLSATLPDSGKFITEIVQLKYADPDQVVKALGLFAKSQASIIYIPSTQSLILRDYSENVKRMLEMVEKIDVSSPLIIKPRVIPIKYALASDISSALSQLGAGGGSSVGRSSSGAGGGAFSRGTSGTGATGAGTQPGGSPFGSATQSGASTGASGARSNFGRALGNIVAGATGGGPGAFSLFGQTKIIADERTNSLLVFANDEDMKMIMEIINKLDVVLAQVLIEAIILEVNLTDTRSTGISYVQNQLSRGRFTGAGGVNNLSSGASSFLNGTGSSTNSTAAATSILPSLPGGFSYFAKWGNDLDVVLEAVASDDRISVLSRPRIQTSHAVEAELFIGQTVPYVTGTYNYGYGSGPSSQYTEKEVGIRLRVLPLINPEGLVVMDIDQEIEQLGAPVTIAGVGDVPTTTKRDAGAKVAVKSGETIILGGFISASRSKGNSGVPWLKDIPLMGALFKSSTMQNLRTELIVLMRPTVLKTPEIAAKVAMDEKHQMAAVEQAELEIRADEATRNAAAAAELAREEARRAKKAGNTKTNAPVDLHIDNTQTNSASQSEMEQP